VCFLFICFVELTVILILLFCILQTLAATGFCELTLDVGMHALRIVDDCGNIWECTVAFDNQPYAHFKIGGNIKQMILGRRLCEGSHVMVGAPVVGGNDTLYFKVIKR
jgi:hypothetical protein